MADQIRPGLFFTISPIKKHPNKEEEEEESVLIIAPFTKRPRINFGEVKLNSIVERSIWITNPQPNDLDLIVTNDELKINNFELKVEKEKTVKLKITWQPDQPGNFNFSIQVEAVGCPRLKFTISAFGVCLKPEEKKSIRKPLSTIQSVNKLKKASLNSELTVKKTITNSNKIEDKENLI